MLATPRPLPLVVKNVKYVPKLDKQSKCNVCYGKRHLTLAVYPRRGLHYSIGGWYKVDVIVIKCAHFVFWQILPINKPLYEQLLRAYVKTYQYIESRLCHSLPAFAHFETCELYLSMIGHRL